MNDRHAMLAPLAWDTEHFGFPVAKIVPEFLPMDALVDALTCAKQRGFHLVYWSTAPQCLLPDELLHRLRGTLADRKVTFRRALAAGALASAAPPSGYTPSGYTVREFPKGPASPALQNLAVAAGTQSRYRADPRFPRAAFDGLYRTWIERSTRGEIADAVLVATSTASDEAHGMVTIAVEADTGRIGLLAVDACARGRGLGGALMRAAHQHMARRGCTQATVATQSDNAAACRLYQSAGYALDMARNVYHFWPGERAA